MTGGQARILQGEGHNRTRTLNNSCTTRSQLPDTHYQQHCDMQQLHIQHRHTLSPRQDTSRPTHMHAKIDRTNRMSLKFKRHDIFAEIYIDRDTVVQTVILIEIGIWPELHLPHTNTVTKLTVYKLQVL